MITYPELTGLRESKEYAAMSELMTALNSYSFNPRHFAMSLTDQHHTLHQNFFRAVQQCVLFMAEPGNITIDNRNRASFELCQRIAPVIREFHLPAI